MASFIQRFSSKTKNIGKRSTKKYLEEALYRKLVKEGGRENSVGKNLNEFLKSHKSAYKWEVGRSVKLLRQRKLYSPAIKLSETMEKRGVNKTTSDQGIHVDLVAKSKGIAAAEAYFINLPETSKNHFTYGALLNCYCKELMTEKAEALIEKMKELNLTLTSMPYNSLMTLYTRTGQPEKIPAIIQEMKECDIMPDSFTYNIWMRALAALGDISGVERVIDEMKRDGRVAEDWTTYSNLASIYADAGLSDKAEKALKELEKKNTPRNLTAYQFLITLYGRIGNLLEVYRIWRSLRLAFPKTANISYLNMIQVLVNLNDMPGAEKCFKEWESGQTTYDIRVANALIGAYAKQGSLKKAKELRKRAQRSGAKPNAKTWEIFLDYYLKKGEISSAVDCIEKAITTGRGDGQKWVPSPVIVGELMRHFETNKDVEGAERVLGILKKAEDQLGAELLESLIRTYAAAGKTSTIMRRRVKMENAELSEEAKKLLDVISAE
nr:pentatricopeptide repeat-containing protein At1g60770 [Ipomoea batatas]